MPPGFVSGFPNCSGMPFSRISIARTPGEPRIRAEWDGPLLRDDGITSKLAKFGFGLGVTRFES
jgi:hypothetical protein